MTTAAHSSEALSRLRGPLDDWLSFLGQADEWGRLLAVAAEEQQGRGYRDTLREICQQPLTWLQTGSDARAALPTLQSAIARVSGNGSGAVVLTGSGSSVYAGECLAPTLQAALRLPISAVPAGELL